MNGLLDYVLVGSALFASIVYAVFALGPRSWRRRLVVAGARLSAAFGLRRLAQRMEIAAANPGSGGCGGCGCNDAKIPLRKIGRRR